MMWSPIQNRMRELIHKSEKERGEKDFNRRQTWGLRLKQRVQSGGGWFERSLAVVMLLLVALCGCCQPFRVWFITMVHALATH